MNRRSTLVAALLVLSASFLTVPFDAQAVPSMARQTGMQCAACHTVFPELTPFGRQFKLRAFSLGSGPKASGDSMLSALPVSAILQVSRTATRDTTGGDAETFPRDRQTVVQTAGVYYGGKITSKSGALVQYGYDGIERKWGMEMFDARYADSMSLASGDLVYGVTLNNNPTLSDIYNSAPAWRFPYGADAGLKPAAQTVLDGRLASMSGGVGLYGMFNNLVYAEVALYRTTNSGIFRPLGAGIITDSVIQGRAPYWRLALQKEMGSHSVSVGAYGLTVDLYPDRLDLSTPTNRFRDFALDAQYQYITETHQVSTQAIFIREKQDWTAGFASGATSRSSTTLNTVRIGGHYYYQRRYGGGLQYFSIYGDADPLLYAAVPITGSANGSPGTRGWVAELNYLPLQNIKLALRFTAYDKFNGARSNYDGAGRNASANNNIFLLGSFLF